VATEKLYYFEGYDFRDDKVVRSRPAGDDEFIERYRLRAVEDNAGRGGQRAGGRGRPARRRFLTDPP
jgi:hypothetical protein